MVQRITKLLGLIVLTGLSSLVHAQMSWSLAGPLYTAGRARNMIVDKNDPTNNTLYVGSTSSGVFKSTNGGATWVPLNDQGTVRNISYMAQGPDGTIYAGTGEGYLRVGQKVKALPGTGLYKLVGNNLVQVISSTQIGTVINRIAVSPISSGKHIAITTNMGVFISSDFGASFSLANGITTHSLISGQDVKFDNTGVLYCSAGSEVGTSTVSASKIYKSTDATLSNFIDITPTSGVLADNNYGRIELAVSPSNNAIVYASCANKNPDGKSLATATLKGLFVTYNGGLNANWSLIIQGASALDPLSNGGTIATGDYAGVLLVNANNPHQLFFGGYSMYVFTRQVGSNGDSDATPVGSWTPLGNPYAKGTPIYLHENFHDIKIIPGSPNRFFFVTDAGIYRSTDITGVGQTFPPSFQPYYKGLVTGQFNSVSIERFPVGANATSSVSGTKVTPYSGFVGGTGGNGLTYYSGLDTLVTQETSYLSGDVYNAEFSKILPSAAFATTGNGTMFRTTNVKSSSPSILNVNRYSGPISKVAPEPETFVNANITTGTPFKLWEFYGQTPVNPDQIFFYNDTVRFQASMGTLAELNSQRTFTFSAIRPNKFALIDSIAIRTGTVVLPISGSGANAPPFSTGKSIFMHLNDSYVPNASVTVITGTTINKSGEYSTNPAEQPTITLNAPAQTDDISVTFLSAPFGDKTVSTTNPAHYRVFATVFYKYKVNDTVSVTDGNISTKLNTYTAKLTQPLNWHYSGGSTPSYTLGVTQNAALSNPTFVSVAYQTSQTNTSLPIVVNPIGVKSYTVTQYGNYSFVAKPVVYTLSVNSDTNISGPTYSFELLPDAITKTVTSTNTAAIVFTVIPTAGTDYTITQSSGTSTTTAVTTISVGPSSYVMNPGNVTQSTNTFVVNIPTTTTASTSYTLDGVSSNTVLGNNTTTTFANYPFKSTHSAGSSSLPFAPNNPVVKIPMLSSARLAVAVNNGANTGNADAVAVAKNPLNLNDPLCLVRISQSGARTDDANGNATTNTVTVNGRATILEWSKGGTELYYATDANELYRVSHITEINDLSPSSYNGKFFTDVFMYNSASPYGVNSATINPNCPYRTTMIGKFDAPISSISMSYDETRIMLTFNNPAMTATAGLVQLSSVAPKTANISNIGWVRKDGGNSGPLLNRITYCSMFDKDNSGKGFVGTDQGLYFTSDFTTANWSNANGKFPNVQVFDIKQQVMQPWDCFNSGQIYAATNGRGVWTNTESLKNYYVGVQEFNGPEENEYVNNLRLFPNPADNVVNLAFDAHNGENIVLQVVDLNGRLVKAESFNSIEGGEAVYNINTSDLSKGIYIVNVSSDSGVKRTAKLIIAK